MTKQVPKLDLPEHFVRAITSVHDDGAEWLAALPEFLAAVADRYELTLGAPFKLSYNYVCAATRSDGRPVVLKVSPPYDEFYTEVAALRHYGVEGCVELLDADPDQGIVILERLFPGETIHALSFENDDEATRIAASVMTKLWRPLPAEHNFPTVERWSRGLQRLRDEHNGATGPLPAHLVERAEGIYRELFASAPPPVLLHGDLHHENILSATRAPYLAIDPKGVAGEPAYEVGPLFYNPQPEIFHQPNLARVLKRRLDVLAEYLPIDRERLLACAFAHSVLSAAWSVEENDSSEGGWRSTILVAETLASL
jgi:streptomycin 6-kinase